MVDYQLLVLNEKNPIHPFILKTCTEQCRSIRVQTKYAHLQKCGIWMELINMYHEYNSFLQEIKNKVVESRTNASKAINKSFIGLYWFIGQLIVEKQEKLAWGKSVVEVLSKDLKLALPEMTGFSPQNLWLARQFYLEYWHSPILQQRVGEIPWGQNILIIQKIKDQDQRQFYLEATAKLG